uniref:Uncharacterized protein n=1 Tax=Nephromyces sp. ex Molgula occidentalis TaxID=2544991 RepID=A0A5C1H8E2_9APIC|nr:hypothetical protein [Nephromyces sp. ex Molgula occidentalis]
MNKYKKINSKILKQKYLKAGVLSYKDRKKISYPFKSNKNLLLKYSQLKYILFNLNISLNNQSLDYLLINPNFYKILNKKNFKIKNKIITIFKNIY